MMHRACRIAQPLSLTQSGARHSVNTRGVVSAASAVVTRSVPRGIRSATAYNHYSLLRSAEDVFGLRHLGYAGQSGLVSFGRDVFTGYRAAR